MIEEKRNERTKRDKAEVTKGKNNKKEERREVGQKP